jgi:hypothetical protein
MMVFGYIIVMFIYLEHVDSAYQKYHTQYSSTQCETFFDSSTGTFDHYLS